MKSILFLDDDIVRLQDAKRTYPETDYRICLVKTASDCIEALSQVNFDIVSLDHDLGGKVFQHPLEENTGSEVVRWIIKNKPEIPLIIVHSWNVDMAREMDIKLRDAGYFVERKMFNLQ